MIRYLVAFLAGLFLLVPIATNAQPTVAPLGFTLAQSSHHGGHGQHSMDHGASMDHSMDHSAHGAMTGHMHHGAMPPVGVMGGHTHGKGGFMLSYRYMRMDMDGNRDGTDSVSNDDVLDDFMVTPLDMTMEMHMLGAMYGLTDNLTLMAMVPYVRKSMDHRTRMGAEFTTKTNGVGDVKVAALYRLFHDRNHHVHLNAGVSLPSGSIDEKDDTPAGDDQQLPYPMQLGSGTVDLMPGLTYLGNAGPWSWGAQALATLHLGENDRDYALGDRINLTGWAARSFNQIISASLRVNAAFWDDIRGADDDLNPMMVPTADPDRRNGSRVDVLGGLALNAPSGMLAGNSLRLEVGVPVYQNLGGPQLETDWMVIAGWSYMF